MPQIILLVTIVVVLVVVWLVIREALRAGTARGGSSAPPAQPEPPEPSQQKRPPEDRATGKQRPGRSRSEAPAPSPEPTPDLGDPGVEELASHVKELRRAVDEDLISRDEAIASIVRYGQGQITDGVAARLLDEPEA